jgi:hypothetical protein
MMEEGDVLDKNGKKRIGQERAFDFYDKRPVLESVDISESLPYRFNLFLEFLLVHDIKMAFGKRIINTRSLTKDVGKKIPL